MYSARNYNNLKITCGVLAVIMLLLIGHSGYMYFYSIPKLKLKVKDEVTQNVKQENLTYVSVYVAKDAIPQGTDLKPELFTLKTVPMGEPEADKQFINSTSAIENKTAVIDIPKDCYLVSNMITKKGEYISPDLRKQDYVQVKLSHKLKTDDYVDIRIKRNDGSDQIVLSKKKIIDLDGQIIDLYVNEEERENFNNATVEAFVTNAIIYTTVYIKPANQPAAEVTYKPNPKIADMIAKDPNLVNSALKDLEVKAESQKPQTTAPSNQSNTAPAAQTAPNAPATQSNNQTQDSNNASTPGRR